MAGRTHPAPTGARGEKHSRGYARRHLGQTSFGRGFDSPRLHQRIIFKVKNGTSASQAPFCSGGLVAAQGARMDSAQGKVRGCGHPSAVLYLAIKRDY